jgi:hypothetical protein
MKPQYYCQEYNAIAQSYKVVLFFSGHKSVRYSAPSQQALKNKAARRSGLLASILKILNAWTQPCIKSLGKLSLRDSVFQLTNLGCAMMIGEKKSHIQPNASVTGFIANEMERNPNAQL